jgi:type IV secretion system protein VirB10
VNQNIPPNQPGSPDYEPSQGGYETQNPYLAGQQEAPPPDLDANAPFLQSPKDRRLNAKMLFFVAGALILLLLVLFLMYRRLTTDSKPPPPPKEEKVAIPDLPDAAPPPLPAGPEVAPPPIDMANDGGVPPLPSQQQGPSGRPQPSGPVGPSLMERRIMASNGGGGGGGDNGGGVEGGGGGAGMQAMQMQRQMMEAAGLIPPTAAPSQEKVAAAHALRNPDALLVRGTYIRCILETRIITDIPGFTSCIVTEPVYSINGRRLLLPKGSKVLGAYDTDATGPRVAVIWDRITTPNGYDINMQSPGVDGLGSAGHPGRYTAHWPSRMASALMISLVADAFKYAAAEHGPVQNEIAPGGVVVQSPYESVTARTTERLADQALRKSMNRPATVIINQGTMLNVYVAQDVDFTGVLPPKAAVR